MTTYYCLLISFYLMLVLPEYHCFTPFRLPSGTSLLQFKKLNSKSKDIEPTSPLQRYRKVFNSIKLIPLLYPSVLLIKSVANAASLNDYSLKGFQTKSGLKYFDLTAGVNGINPKYGQLVSFQYTSYYRPAGESRLEEFDSSYLSGDAFLHKHGSNRIIRGIDEALHSMNVGSKRRIIVPKSLGYVEIGLGPVPTTYSRYGAILPTTWFLQLVICTALAALSHSCS